jgi:hypothetical protein
MLLQTMVRRSIKHILLWDGELHCWNPKTLMKTLNPKNAADESSISDIKVI